MSEDVCYKCKKDLATCETIIAVDSRLFCTEGCAMKHLIHENPRLALERYEAEAEEVTPQDIGII
jgi:hypothetical protein